MGDHVVRQGARDCGGSRLILSETNTLLLDPAPSQKRALTTSNYLPPGAISQIHTHTHSIIQKTKYTGLWRQTISRPYQEPYQLLSPLVTLLCFRPYLLLNYDCPSNHSLSI